MNEVNKNNRELTLVFLSIFLIITSVLTVLFLKKELPDISQESAIYSNLGFYFMINLNVVVIMLLSFFVFRNIFKLLLDRRKNILGSRLRTKLMVAFVGLSLVPTFLLFFVAKGIFDNILQGWFSPQVVSTVDSSMAIAKLYYKQTEEDIVNDISNLNNQLQGEFSSFGKPEELAFKNKLAKIRNDFGFDELALLRLDGDVVKVENFSRKTDLLLPVPKKLSLTSAQNLGHLVQPEEAFGNEVLRVYRPFTSNSGDSSSASPEYYLLASKIISPELAELLSSIVTSFDEYREMHSYKRPLASSYLLTLIMVMLLIIVTAMWISLYLARSLTDPIQKLAEGTEEIAQGNLDYQIANVGDDEIGFLVSSFNSMTSDLKKTTDELIRAQKLAAWQEVAQRVAHEIKNPLTPIQLAAQRVQKRFNKAEVVSSINSEDLKILNNSCSVIVEQTQSIRNMVNEFSRFVRMPEVQLKRSDFNDVIRQNLSIYRDSHPKVQFIESYSNDIQNMLIDKEQISRALNNLLDNAIAACDLNFELYSKKILNSKNISKAESLNTKILIETKYVESKSSIRLSVSDNGPGVSDEFKARVFEPYFTTKKEGTGLGLPIVNNIVADHGGYIRVEDSKFGGSKFVIELPYNK